MPTYVYQCQESECRATHDLSHGMTETPKIKCPICGSTKNEKVFQPINISTHTGKTIAADRIINRTKAQKGMASDLKENYGIHDMTLTRRDMPYEKIYEEIKGNGVEVRDTMKEHRKNNQAKSRKKLTENNKAFAKIRDQRIKEFKEIKAKEAYESRKIDQIKTKPKSE